MHGCCLSKPSKQSRSASLLVESDPRPSQYFHDQYHFVHILATLKRLHPAAASYGPSYPVSAACRDYRAFHTCRVFCQPTSRSMLGFNPRHTPSNADRITIKSTCYVVVACRVTPDDTEYVGISSDGDGSLCHITWDSDGNTLVTPLALDRSETVEHEWPPF